MFIKVPTSHRPGRDNPAQVSVNVFICVNIYIYKVYRT